jgi:hypothetical protein
VFGWLKKKPLDLTDLPGLNSQEKVVAAAKSGGLVPLLLMPTEFGGSPVRPNVVFVPAWVREQKERTDREIIFPLAQSGKITKYSAEPAYKGDSFVPSAIKVRAHDPGDFSSTIEIW